MKASELTVTDQKQLLLRIESHIDFNGPLPDNPSRPVHTNCWLWTRGTMPSGYGSISVNNRTHTVHRLYYELKFGPIPEGHDIDHYCRVRRCLRHMEPVTRLENILRGQQFSVCRKGHALVPDNISRVKGRPHQRLCRECNRQKTARYRTRKAASHG